MLHYELLQRVKLLPLEYSYGEYRDLFRDFGTHYITEAVLGGIYEYTLIMNKEAMERAGTLPRGLWLSCWGTHELCEVVGGELRALLLVPFSLPGCSVICRSLLFVTC